MKDVNYLKFYGERFCLKCEKLLQADEFVSTEVVHDTSKGEWKENKFRCKACSEDAIKFENPFLWFFKAYGLRFGLFFALGIIILFKGFSDLSEYWVLIPVSLVFFLAALGSFFMNRDERKKIKLLVQKIASKS